LELKHLVTNLLIIEIETAANNSYCIKLLHLGHQSLTYKQLYPINYKPVKGLPIIKRCLWHPSLSAYTGWAKL